MAIFEILPHSITMASAHVMNRHLLISIACLLATLFLVPATAQEYAALHYTNNDGLPSNTVYSLYRDSKGYLWIATDKGVARYNGSKFETFTTFDGLPDNEVYFFEEDLQHRLWLGSNNGELCYFQHDTFFSARNKGNLQLPVKQSHAQHAHIESDSSVTFSYSLGTTIVNVDKKRVNVFEFHLPGTPSHNECILTTKLSPATYQVICQKITYTMDTSGNRLSSRTNPYPIDRFTSCQAQTYLYGKDSFSTIDFAHTWPIPNFATTNNYLIEIYNDGQNNFFATGNGLVLGDSIHLFDGEKVSAVTRDAYSNYWVSTLSSGIYCLNKNFDLKTYRNVYRGNIAFTHASAGQIYFATNRNELFRVSAGTSEQIISRPALSLRTAPGLYQTAFFIDSNYRYYNFSDSTLIFIKDVSALHPGPIIIESNKLGLGYKGIFYANNKFYVKRYNCIDVFSIDPVRKMAELPDPKREKIFGMAKDPSGAIWYSSISSVYKIDRDSIVLQKQFGKYFLRSIDFICGYMLAITQSNELLLIGNPDKDPQIDTVRPQQCIWESVYRIDSSHAIISTNNSYMLLSLQRATGKPRYDKRILENAFIPLQAQAIAACDSTIYFFGNGSITSIAMSKLLYTPGPPKLFFTRIQTTERAYPIDSIVTIPYSESKSLRILFSRLSFGKIRSFLEYAVAKNGQYTWTDFNADELNLAHPGFGDYVIMIRARTFSSDYSAPIMFTLRILRPFWAQWWFIALVISGLLVLITALLVLIRRKALRATQQKNLQMELELKAIYAQINPHFIFNTLNTALMLVRKKRLEDAYAHISQFSRLLRSYMKSSRNKFITIADEIGNLTDYLELQKARFVDKFGFTIFVDQTIDPYSVKIPSLLLQPFVENALTHGLLTSKYPGRLIIEFVPGQGQGEIVCKIDDNGIGRAAARSVNKGIEDKDDSYGNLLIRDLVSIFNKYEQMNIEISYIDKDEPDTGTTVLISIMRPRYE